MNTRNPKLIAGVGSAIAATVGAVLLGTAGLASAHSTPNVANHHVVVTTVPNTSTIGLTLTARLAPAHPAASPTKAILTSASTAARGTTKPTTGGMVGGCKPGGPKGGDPGGHGPYGHDHGTHGGGASGGH